MIISKEAREKLEAGENTCRDEQIQKLEQDIAELQHNGNILARRYFALRAAINLPEIWLDDDWKIIGYTNDFLHLVKNGTKQSSYKDKYLKDILREGEFKKIENYLSKVKILKNLPYEQGNSWELKYKGPNHSDVVGDTWLKNRNMDGVFDDLWSIENINGKYKIIHKPHINDSADCYLMTKNEYGGPDEDVKVIFKIKTSKEKDNIRDISLVLSGNSGEYDLYPDFSGYTICTGTIYNTYSVIQRRATDIVSIPEQLDTDTEYRIEVERTGGRITRKMTNLVTGKESPNLEFIDSEAIYERDNHLGFVTFSGEMEISEIEIYTRKTMFSMKQFQIPFDVEVSLREPALRDRIFRLKFGTTVFKDYSSHTALLFEDITERRNAEREINRAKREKEVILNSISEQVVFYKNPDMKVAWANKAACDALGCDSEKIKEKYCYEVTEGTDEICKNCHVLDTFQTKKPMERVRCNRFDRKLLIRTYPVVDEKGNLEGVVKVSRDITDKQHSEEMQALIATALSQAAESITITDSEGRVEYVNPAFETTTGFKSSEVLGKTPFDVQNFEHDEEFYEKLHKTIESGGVWSGKFTKHKKDGTLYYEEGTISPVKNDGGRIINYIALMRDTTHQTELELQLRQAQKLESIGQLAAGIAHEINNPIQYVGDNLRFFQESFVDIRRVIESFTSLLDTSREKQPEPAMISDIENTMEEADLEYLFDEIPSAISQGIEGVERVVKIVQAMKEFSHPGRNEKQLANINKAIESTVTVARNEWKYVADLETDLDSELPSVPCYIGEFNQVILNMIINAAHAIEEKVGDGVNGKGKITISTGLCEPDCVEVRISDTGAGIPDEFKDRVFDLFFTTKEVGKGTGQGLAIAHNVIVDKHKGKIDFKSERGKGTTFIIQLPLATEDDN